MNKRHYKVIFSRVLNQLVVVSELAKSQGKAQSENMSLEQEKTGLFSTALSLNPIHFSLMLALGFVFLSPSVQAEDMAIRADKSAPGNQQPTVLQTGNGIPQVNIQAPSQAGVSRNQYSQFDVAEKGAVLNNARKASQTQMAGWVQGNPNLARGEAKVILNEVNSANPSRLKGYVEVAGKKADVVIANPSGIQCDGCGVINAGRATFTTGKAEVENGELKGYRVQGGKVSVGQKGMDTSKADYTDIIADKAEIKGGVWGNKVKITTGKNKVDRTNDSVVYVGDKNTNETDRTSESQNDQAQAYSVDVGQLGGMYAEKIHLVDNGQGLGVRNAGHIGAAAGEVKIDSQGKIVNEGFIGGSENTQLNAKKNIENRGTVYAKAQAQLNAQNIDNKQGVIAGKQVQLSANNVDNRKQSDKGSLIVASDKVSVKAKNVDNQGTKANSKTEQGIRGAQVAIIADNLSNQQGGIYTDEHANLNITKTIDNKDGEIEASKSIELTAKTLANDGSVKTKGDLTVHLQDGLVLNNAFQAGGSLDFKTQGNLTNNSQLRVGNKLSVQAANIENTKEAEISGNETHINTNTLTNRGLIDGALTVAKAVTINNLGTGRIYGDHLALQGDTLNNLEEDNKSAVIAARERLDIGVDRVLNRNESTLLSMGKIYVGKTLDEDNQAAGKSTYVHNHNGVIEALNIYDDAKSKAITFNTGLVENKHFFLETENVDTSSTPVFEYRIGNDSTIYGKDSGVYKVKQDNKSGRWGLNRKIRDLYHIFSPDGKIESDNWHEYDYTRTVNETVVLKPKYQEGKILSGGGIDFNDARVDNQDSKVIAGGVIETADGQLNNEEFKGRTIVTDKGKVTAYYKARKKRNRFDRYYTTASDTNIYFKQNESVKDLGVFAYKENVAPEFTNTGVAGKANVGDVILNRLTQSLDKSSLYNINPDAPNGYVIETDPRFANKQKWLSSDYMLNALQYSPDNMHKRLGDGFYELRLVNEQINQLTGRRYLEGYQNDLEQYQGLMNNGVHYAKKLNLVPGVALTEKQMSELTTDLVWMVNEEVTLPGGKKLNVLTPKIYLASNRAQVTPTGSVISGDSIVAKVTSMNNEGTLIASNLVNVYGQDLQNKGVVLADNVNLNAEQKLVNLGGKIVAADSLSLYGGKSVELGATTTETQSQLGRTETGNKQVDRQSELKVTGKGGELSIQSGGDITIKAANVKSAGTVDVNAKGKLLVTTEKQSSKEHYDFSDNHHYHLDKEDEVSSVIEGKEGTRLVGQEETTLRQAKVNSEEGRTIIASQGEVKLEEGRDIEHLDRRNKQTSKGFLTKETEEMRRHHDYDLSKGSEVNGKDVIVYSQDANATVKGSSITAQDGLLVQAKNVNVKEAENNAYVEEHYEKKRSGLATSFKGGVAKIGYEKSKSNLDSKSISLEAAGSQLTGGTTTLVAENVLTVRGSDLNSQEQSDLRAKQVNLEAAKEVHHTEVHQSSKTSGFGLSMVYDPTLKAIDQYKQRQKQGGTETVVGKINSIAEAGADAVELMSRGIVPYLEHKRSKSDKTTIETTAKVTAVNAGGQLNVVASEGDIRTQGTQIAAEKGATFLASNNIELGTAENTYTQQANTSDKGFSLGDANKYLFGVHTQRENGDATQTQEVSTTISVGGNNQIVAQKGDIHAKGAKIVSEGKNQLSAAGNVVLDTAVTTQETTQQRKGHAVGEAVISDSERFYGYNRTRFNQDGNFTHHEKAQLASLGDKVEVYAGKDYRQTSAEILSKDKASINAQNIIVDSAFNTDKYKQSESDLKFGQFTRVKSPIIDLINSIESTVKNKKASDRVQAANIMSVAAQAYNLASAFQGQGGASYLIRVESGTGVAHSRKKEDSYQHTSQGNLFNAKEIEFTARGDGSTNAQGNPQLGNINITHADITSVDEKGNRLKDSSVTFNANNLTIDPGKSTVDQHARSQSAGVEVGMAATIGAQTGIGIYARVGGSSSKTNVEGVNYTNSHLNTETLNINTQGDTTLTGTTAKAKTINANVGGNLNIASVQDENKFETKSSGGGLEVEFGWGNNWRVSGYGNSEKGKSSYKQVKEQAGLFAEEGGYHVNAKNVHLKGAAITSTNPENSELSTNKLTFEDIQNESHSDASSMSFSASYSKGGSAPKDNSSSGTTFSQIASKMKDSFSSNGPTSSSTSFGGGLPMNESDSDNSVTRATLTEGKITLNKDTAPMQTTAQALGINTDINQTNGEVDKPKDVNQILSEQRQISAAAGNIKSAVNTYVARQKAPLLQEIERLEGEKKELETRQDQAGISAVEEQLDLIKSEVAEWESGGKYHRAADALTSTIIGALSGQSATSIAATAASPYVNVGIKNATTNEEGEVNTVANIAAHALWGAVEAKALGGSGTSGALAAGIAELSAPVAAKLSQIINEVSSDESLPSTTAKMKAIVNKIKTIDKGMDPSELSNKEKEMLVGITSFIGQVVAQATSKARGADSDTASKNVKIGGIVAKNAVANNYLSRTEIEQYYKDLKDCNGKEECEKDVKQRNIALSAKHTEELELACGGDKRSSAECREHREKARDGLKAARFNEYKVQSAALDKSNEIPEIADSALEKSNEIPKTAGSALVEERVDLPEVEVRGTATPKYELDIKSLVYHDNLSDIAYAEPNRANAEAIREVLYANYFPNSNQPARIETYFRDFADVLRYNIQDKRPRIEGYLHNKIIDSVINNTLNEKNNSVWNKPLSQIPGELNQVVYKSVGRGLDKFAVGTVSAIYDLSLLADEVRNAPFKLLVDSDYRNKVTTSADNHAKLVNKLVTDNEYRENVINYVTDVAKNKVDNVGELLKQGNPGDFAEIGSDVVSIAADFVPIGAPGKLGKVSDGLGDLGKAADKIHDAANVGRGADKVHDVGNVAKATEQLKTCSFRGDMEVKTEQGYKPIQSIKVGDKVYAKNELTGQMSYQHVQAHYNNPYDFTVYVEVIDEQGKHQIIVSNKIHPFFTQVNQGELVASSEGHFYKGEIQNAQWVDAQNLKAGYKLLSENNQWQTVKDVSIKAEKLSAYNLTVENDHTYFIKGANSDSDGVWVHNECYIGIPEEAKEAGKINGYKAYTFTENGEIKTVIQTGERRFETLDQPKALDPTLNGSQTKTIKVDFDETRIKNSEAHKIVNDLDVNTRYELSNGTKFKTNDYGYVEEISFKPIDEKMPRTSQQTAIGYLGEIGDVGGHIQACRYGGTCDRYNLFPQNGNFNNSAYKVYFENIVKKAVDQGKALDVVIKFERSTPNSPRPDKLRVTIGVEGGKYRYVNEFKNQYGGGK
ncbi:hemagglutinin repeat-containing protein [Haemophilus parainfluenzae]|uniref:two-partner secretion domain-containing protein n=1 Tax=Haemophilus parainfluenzae TaxID=729 RepID=UPI0018A46B07|nr:hemagglutinin repeat-containing protein [Haemophilus parainfluenzae]QOR07255.1 hemagglutinin repeat-containing protein [Haemophilus parainfluenzae]